MATTLSVIISGLLLGGIYALIAMGLGLQYGVARVLNVSHGEFIMLGALATWWLHTSFGINPLVSLAISGPLAFLIGYALHSTVFTRLRKLAPSAGAYEGNSLLASFGLLFIIQNLALSAWGSDTWRYSYLAFPVRLGETVFAANRLVALSFAVVVSLGFYLFLARTRLGKAIRAAAQDPATAQLMGIDIRKVLSLCFGLGAVMAAFAGLLISTCFPIHVNMGLGYTVIAIIVVVLGGLGSVVGSFIGGFILGLIGSVVTYLDPALSLVAYYAIFILLLLVRPRGIMGRG
jgi:branched-chain amino acid transport system permease protein